MRLDEPRQDAFDFNDFNHEMFLQEVGIDNIDDNDPLDLHTS